MYKPMMRVFHPCQRIWNYPLPAPPKKNHIAVVIHSAMLKGLVVVADKFHSFNRPEYQIKTPNKRHIEQRWKKEETVKNTKSKLVKQFQR
jgi:hypothetical protein